MDSIRRRFDQILSDHLERLLGRQSSLINLPIDLLNISIIIFLAEQAANERDQMISEEDRYSRKTLHAELAEVGFGSTAQFDQALDEMFSRSYIVEDDSGRLIAGESLVEVAQLLDSILPKMPGLNLIAYMAQALDETTSGRKELEDAARQFDQTLSIQGVCIQGSQELSPNKTEQKQIPEQKMPKGSISDEVSQRLIKSIHNEVENKPARQSKVLSAKNQNEIKPVSFGKVKKIPETDTHYAQEEEILPDLAEEVQNPEPEEIDDKVTEIVTPSDVPNKDDSDLAAVESESQNRQDPEGSQPENNLDDTDILSNMSTGVENRSRHLKHDLNQRSKLDEVTISASATTSEDLLATQASTQDEETAPEPLETTDENIEKEISKFETDLAMQCPICKSGQIVSEVTTKGKNYYKCPNKSCNFISWGKPFHNECPRCHNPFLIEAQKNGTTVLKCPRATCNYWQGGPESQEPSNQKSTARLRASKSGAPKRRRRVVKRRVVRRKK